MHNMQNQFLHINMINFNTFDDVSAFKGSVLHNFISCVSNALLRHRNEYQCRVIGCQVISSVYDRLNIGLLTN